MVEVKVGSYEEGSPLWSSKGQGLLTLIAEVRSWVLIGGQDSAIKDSGLFSGHTVAYSRSTVFPWMFIKT